MKDTLLLTLLTLLASTGCASHPVVQSRGSLREFTQHGATYHLDASRAGLGENDLRGLRERLRQAGLTPAAAATAKLVVTLTSEARTSAERRHTGGKNGVAYDQRIDERRLTLTVAENGVTPGRNLTERRHTGGKHGVAYDHPVGDRGIILEVTATDVTSTSAEKLLKEALAAFGG
ncbi:MAG: hypothetical protein ACKO3A_00110 [Opitutia bacterium]